MSVKQRWVRSKQRGDTIVEVMLVLAVLGLAIGISYRIANKSLMATQEAEETVRATQLLQAQVELLYSLSSNHPTAGPTKYLYTQPGPFCIDPSTDSIMPPPSSCTPSIYTLVITPCNGSSDPRCNIPPNPHTGDDTFLLTAQWDAIGGQGKDTVQLTYRVHEPS